MKAIVLASNCVIVIVNLTATLYDQLKIFTDTDTTSLFCSKTFQCAQIFRLLEPKNLPRRRGCRIIEKKRKDKRA